MMHVTARGAFLAASVLLLLPATEGWIVPCALPRRLHPRAPSHTHARWTAQLNPVEQFATNLRDAVAGVAGVGNNDENYHQQRIKHHEDRVRHHEERMQYHRAQLASSKTARKGGGLEERLRIEAVASGRPMQILFVDLSNTCRSPAAEAIMRSMIQKTTMTDQITVRSCSTGAGTRDWFKQEISADFETERVDPRMVSHAAKRGLQGLSGRQSVLLSKSELTAADLIVIMDNANLKEVQAAAAHWGVKASMSKVRLLTQYSRSGTITTSIPDPYYGGRSGQASGQVFEKVLDLLEDGCKGLLRDCAPEAV